MWAAVPVHQEGDVPSLPLIDLNTTRETSDLCPLAVVVEADAGQLVRRDDVPEGPSHEGVKTHRGVGVPGPLGVLVGLQDRQLLSEALQDEGTGRA